MNKTKRLQTIDGESLMSLPLTPLNFVVDTLLSQGLHILAGSPKVGKSWLALWLSVMVAKGEPVWGMSVKQGTTLYLCLEDSTLRIQNRLFEITEDAPSNVHFSTGSDILGKGLEEQLCTFLAEHPDTVLVIIGTPTELSEKIDPAGSERITPNKVSRLILQNLGALSKIGISGVVRRSNGKRLVELRRADSVDIPGIGESGTCDPVEATGGDLQGFPGEVE